MVITEAEDVLRVINTTGVKLRRFTQFPQTFHPPLHSSLLSEPPIHMPRDPLIALVGKPSSGKSTTLNSLTDATAKVGNFPFTTIDPQKAIGFLQIPCACARFGLEDRCKPNYGSCVQGRRSVPIELLDVAGLVPGAHLGKGLGNQFLDDLRHADALIHVVDVSGTTDAEGECELESGG